VFALNSTPGLKISGGNDEDFFVASRITKKNAIGRTGEEPSNLNTGGSLRSAKRVKSSYGAGPQTMNSKTNPLPSGGEGSDEREKIKKYPYPVEKLSSTNRTRVAKGIAKKNQTPGRAKPWDKNHADHKRNPPAREWLRELCSVGRGP